MCIIETLNKTPFILMGLISVFAIGLLHITIGILRKEPDFDTYALFNSSLFYDFSLSDNICKDKEINVFHTWAGRKQYFLLSDYYSIKDVTDITKINGYYFCYKKIPYLDLLNNGQIIKKGTECPEEYKKNCGRIDTLNQELCIKENEKCPLYDVGIGYPPYSNTYTYDENSNIYYNNENYNDPNKKIIGKLILSDGQPCYDPNEKLWHVFDPYEVNGTHINCINMKIFGKYSDDRFKRKEDISYKRLYNDNLNEKSKEIVIDKIGYESVSLYKREFLGIDKKCNENFVLSANFKSLKSIQNADKIIQILQGCLMASVTLVLMIMKIVGCSRGKSFQFKLLFRFYIFYIVISCGFLIPKILAFLRMKENGYSNDYNCSDSITNEVIRIGSEKGKKIFTYNKICLFSDVTILACNFLVVIVGLLWDIISKKIKINSNKPYGELKGVEIPYASYQNDN